MNTKKLADALNTASVALAEMAEALLEQPAGDPAGSGASVRPPDGRTAMPSGAAMSAPSPAPIFDTEILEEIIPDEPQGHLLVCPAHRQPFKEGKFGPYCPGKGIDPAWTNSRGYCTVTPKNADVYLRAHAA